MQYYRDLLVVICQRICPHWHLWSWILLGVFNFSLVIYFNYHHLFRQSTLLQHFCCWKCYDLHSWKPHSFAKEELLLRLFYWQEIKKHHKNSLKQISVVGFSCVEKEFLFLLKSLLLFYYNNVFLWFPFILISFYLSVVCVYLRFFSHKFIKGFKSMFALWRNNLWDNSGHRHSTDKATVYMGVFW